jgi:hypothetical protein
MWMNEAAAGAASRRLVLTAVAAIAITSVEKFGRTPRQFGKGCWRASL